jgi:hypothetical protein
MHIRLVDQERRLAQLGKVRQSRCAVGGRDIVFDRRGRWVVVSTTAAM